ncbi:MAG: NAD(P)H-dependent oxidoreductase [Chitinophagaceae bacterium]|jgi:NAD(P)H-dependent FMN reductase|nr:NAD(P)H-dependent oxidoreductase [Chitinophagaceae bacterium]
MRIAIISASPRANSVTYRVALFLQNYLAQHTEHQIDMIDVRDYHLPMLQEVWTSVEKTPDEFKPLSEKMFGADAFIMVTPEYNGSYAPAMKLIFDQYPKQSRKAFGIVTASPGAMGGMRATQQMQLLVPALFGILSPYMLVIPAVDKKFDEAGNLTDANFQKQVDLFAKEYLWLAETLKGEAVPVLG